MFLSLFYQKYFFQTKPVGMIGNFRPGLVWARRGPTEGETILTITQTTLAFERFLLEFAL